jgi:hypothetical protein
VKGNEAVGAPQAGDGRWDVIGEDEADNFGESGKVGRGWFIVGYLRCGREKGAGLEGVGEVGKGAAGCASLEVGEGSVEFVVVEGESGVVVGGAACAGVGLVMVLGEGYSGWVELLALLAHLGVMEAVGSVDWTRW